jgi:hypothetical protein
MICDAARPWIMIGYHSFFGEKKLGWIDLKFLKYRFFADM